MTRRRTWSEEALAELRAVKPGERGAARRIADRYGHSVDAVRAKLSVLRAAGKAVDAKAGRRGDPFPASRYRWYR